MTIERDRDRFLRIARDAIVAHMVGLPAPDINPEAFEGRRGGAFVTLHHGAELRGCIGHIEPDEPLARIVARCAVGASTSDPRFAAVGPSEIDRLTIEISILGPLEPIGGPDDIEIGRHGLVVEKGTVRGLLLPQVAVEWRWNREEFLAQVCRKAGLATNAWTHGARVWRFEAEVFGEKAGERGTA